MFARILIGSGFTCLWKRLIWHIFYLFGTDGARYSRRIYFKKQLQNPAFSLIKVKKKVSLVRVNQETFRYEFRLGKKKLESIDADGMPSLVLGLV